MDTNFRDTRSWLALWLLLTLGLFCGGAAFALFPLVLGGVATGGFFILETTSAVGRMRQRQIEGRSPAKQIEQTANWSELAETFEQLGEKDLAASYRRWAKELPDTRVPKALEERAQKRQAEQSREMAETVRAELAKAAMRSRELVYENRKPRHKESERRSTKLQPVDGGIYPQLRDREIYHLSDLRKANPNLYAELTLDERTKLSRCHPQHHASIIESIKEEAYWRLKNKGRRHHEAAAQLYTNDARLRPWDLHEAKLARDEMFDLEMYHRSMEAYHRSIEEFRSKLMNALEPPNTEFYDLDKLKMDNPEIYSELVSSERKHLAACHRERDREDIRVIILTAQERLQRKGSFQPYEKRATRENVAAAWQKHAEMHRERLGSGTYCEACGVYL